jgi:hypothetical protein
VFDAARHDEHVAFRELDVPRSELDGQAPLIDAEDLVLVVVLVPVGRADSLGDLEEISVGLADDPLGPELIERRGYGLERPVAGWGSIPLKIADLHGVLRSSG